MTPMRAHGFRRFISLTVSCLISLSVAVLSPVQGRATSRFLDAPVTSCNGPYGPIGSRDLWVNGGLVVLQGEYSFDRVCIDGGGTLRANGALTLHVGLLYIAANSALVADGLHAFDWANHDCYVADTLVNGESGNTLTILAQRAVIDGRISANGGYGISYLDGGGCSDGLNVTGMGGSGGYISIIAHDLTLAGRIISNGGIGGSSIPPDPTQPSQKVQSGDGGNGGTIVIKSAQPAAVNARHLEARAGQTGVHKPGFAGHLGRAGIVQVTVLDAADRALLPPAPAVIFAQSAAHVQPLQSRTSHALATLCTAHDLVVSSGQIIVLKGSHAFAHICIASGGVLAGQGMLTLVAHDILVSAGGRISLDGASRTAMQTGRYDSSVPCSTNHIPGHAGVTGPIGVWVQSLTNPTPFPTFANSTYKPQRVDGSGGGVLTLIAQSIAIEGDVTANGADGQAEELSDDEQTLEQGTLAADGGGSGGSITVVTHQLELGGLISVLGGRGGSIQPQAQDTARDTVDDIPDPDGLHGGAGCIKVLADQVSAASPALPTYGSTFVDRRLPSDPVAPVPPSPHLIYIASAHHTLADPFLTFWKANGGLSIFGYPQTEAFREGGHEVQYTDRALFEVIHGQVEVAPLGRVLTVGRHFTRVAPVPSTPERLYFAATGHTLSGQFLAFWRTHRGSVLLGAPISEVLVDTNGDGSGRKYPLQWFERGRLEYHAELAKTPYKIELGLLGVEALQVRGWRP